MGKLRRLRINKGERSGAFKGATSGAVVGGASGAGVGAAIGLAMIPIAPISVPIGFLVGGLIGGACGAPSGAAVAVKRGRNSVVELNVADAQRYGDHKTADMMRLRDDVELPAQAEDPSSYAAEYEKMDVPASSSASSSIPEEEGQFSAWLNPMGLSAPATTPSYAYTPSSTSSTSAYTGQREDPAERLLRSKTTSSSSSSSKYASADDYGQESNRGRRTTSAHKTSSFDHNDYDDDGIDYDEDELGLERRRGGSSRRGTSSSSRSQRYASGSSRRENVDYQHRPGNLVPVLPPQPATDVHLRHFDPQEEMSRRFDSWERRDRDREQERQEQERRDEFYAKQLQLQYDRESGGGGGSSSSRSSSSRASSSSSGSTRRTTREVPRKKEVDPAKTLDSLWGSEPFY